jgi:hypothetical protein
MGYFPTSLAWVFVVEAYGSGRRFNFGHYFWQVNSNFYFTAFFGIFGLGNIKVVWFEH